MIDALIAGGGPSGLATALALARAGREVVVFEPHEGVIDKACGEGLMPGTLHALDRLDVQVGGYAFDAIRYRRDATIAAATLPAPGRGVRRTELHAALHTAAVTAGVRFVPERVTQPILHTDHVEANGHTARWLIGADGLRSKVRAALGLERPSRWPARIGLRKHFSVPPEAHAVDVWWGENLEAYVTPVGPDLVGVALLLDRSALGHGGEPFDRLLARIPALAERLQSATEASAVRGAGPFAVGSRRRTLGRALLVGDAAGYLDPLTGEGLKLGLLGALDAADAVISSDLATYERRWAARYRTYEMLTGGLLMATRSLTVRRNLPALLSHAPWLMRAVLRAVAD